MKLGTARLRIIEISPSQKVDTTDPHFGSQSGDLGYRIFPTFGRDVGSWDYGIIGSHGEGPMIRQGRTAADLPQHPAQRPPSSILQVALGGVCTNPLPNASHGIVHVMTKRIGILVVGHPTSATLASVLNRIPSDFRHKITKVLISDDHSADSTYPVGPGYQQATADLPIEVMENPRNLGYGGHQKVGFEWAIAHDLDIVVLLHGDGRYAPEQLPALVAPLEAHEADVVFGSRMLVPGAARRGGMPAYKYVGNRMLTTFENTVAGAQLSEWHSGYRAYSVNALRAVPFAQNDDGFNFDTQIILQCIEAGQRITEVPIPTYDGDEICSVNGLGHARDITRNVIRYRVQKMGFGEGDMAFASSDYEMKLAADSSHQQLLDWMGRRAPGRVLDLGCGDGSLATLLTKQGHTVTGVDIEDPGSKATSLHQFYQGDLDRGLPSDLGGPFDVVLCADVLEHVRRPGDLFDEMAEVLAPGGVILASIPNFAHWYPRLRVVTGRFDYDRRGILDRDHVRFFTRRSFERLASQHKYRIVRRGATGLPVEIVNRGGTGDNTPTGGLRAVLARADRVALAIAPTLFSYQLLYELTRD